MEPLRLGVLGAARIASDAIARPARSTGHRVVAVAARDRARAERFAADHGVERVALSYEALIEDPEIEAVYNPLPNALHAPWSLAAIEAGKHVLCEKPFASNGDEAMIVRFAAAAAGVQCMEAFHYRYHPVMERMVEIVGSGLIGEVVRVEARMLMPPPGAEDPRWDLALAGGALMDVGCYAVHALRSLGQAMGAEPVLDSARAGCPEQAPGVDSWLEAEFVLASGAHARLVTGMTHGVRDFSLRLIGTAGEAFAPAFVLPHLDDRVIVTRGWSQQVEELGRRPSYEYQLDAFARLVRFGEPVHTDASDAVATMRLIDAVYLAADLEPRPTWEEPDA